VLYHHAVLCVGVRACMCAYVCVCVFPTFQLLKQLTDFRETLVWGLETNPMPWFFIFVSLNNVADPSDRSMAWVYGRSLTGIVDSNPAEGTDALSLVSVVCCQVLSATGWSLVQRSPTECGVSEVWSWSLNKWDGLGPQGAVEPLKKK
jgi:hypothetical protein